MKKRALDKAYEEIDAKYKYMSEEDISPRSLLIGRRTAQTKAWPDDREAAWLSSLRDLLWSLKWSRDGDSIQMTGKRRAADKVCGPRLLRLNRAKAAQESTTGSVTRPASSAALCRPA